MNIYGSKRLTIATPRFIVFYNGEDDSGDIREYKLSEMFVKAEEHPQLELVVKIININNGQSNSILDNCKTLREYSQFVAAIRNNRKTMSIEDAVVSAVDECIKQGILREFLLKNKARAILHEVLDAPGEGYQDEHI